VHTHTHIAHIYTIYLYYAYAKCRCSFSTARSPRPRSEPDLERPSQNKTRVCDYLYPMLGADGPTPHSSKVPRRIDQPPQSTSHARRWSLDPWGRKRCRRTGSARPPSCAGDSPKRAMDEGGRRGRHRPRSALPPDGCAGASPKGCHWLGSGLGFRRRRAGDRHSRFRCRLHPPSRSWRLHPLSRSSSRSCCQAEIRKEPLKKPKTVDGGWRPVIDGVRDHVSSVAVL
jgi:hypothetical protein